MFAAVEWGDLKVLHQLKELGLPLDEAAAYGRRPLDIAIAAGKDLVVEFLISHGVDFQAPNRAGEPPIFAALEHNNINTVKLLAEHGANLNFRTPMGKTLLETADRKRQIDLVDWLVARGASRTLLLENLATDTKDVNGRIPLF